MEKDEVYPSSWKHRRFFVSRNKQTNLQNPNSDMVTLGDANLNALRDILVS